MKTKVSGCFLVILVFLCVNGFGQTLNIRGGITISKLDWQLIGLNNDQAWDENLIGYSFFAGLDYVEKPWYNLSANAGMFRRGGKGEIELTNINGDSLGTITSKPALDYLSINTTLDLKRQLWNTITPFVSIGPRIDYLISYSDLFESVESIDALEKIAFGLTLGGGIKYNPSKLQIGLRADYFMDFTKVAEWKFENGNGGEITTSTFAVQLILGYPIK